MSLRANPYCDRGEWFWSDENDFVYGPYYSQRDALYDLLRYWDDQALTWTARVWAWLKSFPL
jgi:hypothetical protein